MKAFLSFKVLETDPFALKRMTPSTPAEVSAAFKDYTVTRETLTPKAALGMGQVTNHAKYCLEIPVTFLSCSSLGCIWLSAALVVCRRVSQSKWLRAPSKLLIDRNFLKESRACCGLTTPASSRSPLSCVHLYLMLI